MASKKTDVRINKPNEDSAQNSESDGSTSKTFKVCTPKEGRSWFRQRLESKMSIGMPEFCEEFGYKCEQDAHDAFSNLLSDSRLQLSSRTAVQKAYELWRRNEGGRFWACQATDYVVNISTIKTEGDLVVRSQYFARKRLRSRGDPNGWSY